MISGRSSFQNHSIMAGGMAAMTPNSNQLRSVQLPTPMKTIATPAIQLAMRYQRHRGEDIKRSKLTMDHYGIRVRAASVAFCTPQVIASRSTNPRPLERFID